MREKRSFARRTKILSSDEVKKKYLLVYEGEKTEQIYFDALSSHKDEIGINPLIELIPITRSYSEDGWSNPKKMLDRILQNIEENETGIYTYETLMNRIMDYLYEKNILSNNKVQAAHMWVTLNRIGKDKLHVSLTDIISDPKNAVEVLARYFYDEPDIQSIIDDIPNIILNGSITYAEGLDKICFIIDRDRKSFTVEQYDNVLKKCRENGFEFCLSNPCFEFWLLLHFDEVFNLDQEQLLDNTKVTASRRYAENELRKLLKGYTKAGYNAELLMSKVDNAIQNAKKFCENDEELENSLGSKIGLLIEKMRSQ